MNTLFGSAVAVSAAILVFMFNAAAHAASFDCSKAKTPGEKAICKDQALGKADEQMASHYAELLKALPKEDLEPFKQEQLNWVKKRNACGDDATCLNQVYSDRNKALSARLDKLSKPRETQNKDSASAEILAMAEYYLRGKHDLWDAEFRVLGIKPARDHIRVELATGNQGYALDIVKETGAIANESTFTP